MRSEQTFLAKIGADSGQFRLKFGAKSGKSEKMGSNHKFNDIIITGNQP